MTTTSPHHGPTTMTTLTTIKHGPLTFVRRDNDGNAECWDVLLPKDLGLPHFGIKNYGGEPSDDNAFSGWRVVSGGPFTRAGGWGTRDKAIEGATPWLVAYYKREATEAMAKAERITTLMTKIIGELDDSVFQKNAPPHVGWWLCNSGWWRWWDGEAWSHGVRPGCKPRTVQRAASKRIPRKHHEGIEWCNYWPEDARVPRISPVAAT